MVAWLVELTVRAGKRGEVRSLTLEMVRSAENEPGTLVYHRHLNSDRTLHANDRYHDSDAAIQRLSRFNALYAERRLGPPRFRRRRPCVLPGALQAIRGEEPPPGSNEPRGCDRRAATRRVQACRIN